MVPQADIRPTPDATYRGLWVAIVVISVLLGFVLGYGTSSRTGVEPGYFEAPEAGGYGVAASAGPKMGEDMRKYYEDLLK
jgi:hypothetical protein